MKLLNFTIHTDNIGLLYEGQYLDIHNNFDFRSLLFDNLARTIILTWTRADTEWAKEKVEGFQLVFNAVTFFKVRERGGEVPHSEDTCLSFIGFLGQDMRDNFDSFIDHESIVETDDLTINFQSDQAFKINAASISFREIEAAII